VTALSHSGEPSAHRMAMARHMHKNDDGCEKFYTARVCDVYCIPVNETMNLILVSNETHLQDRVVDFMVRRGNTLVNREYDVVPGKSQYGKGDLVFKTRSGHTMVVEVKAKNPRKASEQAARYAAWASVRMRVSTVYSTYVDTDPRNLEAQLKDVNIMKVPRANMIVRAAIRKAAPHFFCA
jgi:hypothetical protein